MSERTNGTSRSDCISELYGKLDGLRSSLDRLDEQILTMRRCIIYINDEINKNNEIISRYISGNARRLELVREFSEKLDNLVDQRDSYYKEYISLIPLDNIEVANNEFEKIFDISKLNINVNK